MAKIFTSEEASSLVKTHLQIHGTATALAGDVDQNFKIVSQDGSAYLLKIAEDNDARVQDFQHKILSHLESQESNIVLPKLLHYKTLGLNFHIKLLSWVEGRLWASVNPKLSSLRQDFGEKAGSLTAMLLDFEHDEGHNYSNWDLANCNWTLEHLDRFKGKQHQLISYFQSLFQKIEPTFKALPKSIVHNDLNDYNILVTQDLISPKVSGFIDFGDAVYTQTINDLAIALAYAIMDVPDPLQAALEIIEGYNKEYSLLDEELRCLYTLIGMRLVVSVTKSSIRKAENPENDYHTVSEKPAWELLQKWYDVNEEFAYYSFRKASGYNAHPSEEKFVQWAKKTKLNFSDLFPTVAREEISLLDLKLSSRWIGSRHEFNNLDYFQYQIDELQKAQPNAIIAGGYCEPRPIYTSTAYDKEGNNGPESRAVHLGIDFWLPTNTPVHAVFDAEIFTAVDDAGYKEYGGLIILKHHEEGLDFYTLHGHLTADSPKRWKVGDLVKKGDCIGYLGNQEENGVWASHLHFQYMLSMLDYKLDFPGVAYPEQLSVWKSMCPDPNLFFKNTELVTQYDTSTQEILSYRKTHLGKSMSLSYNEPLHIVRGDGALLLDSYGRKYLDTANNVAHVGHEHPKVVEAGRRQMSVLNTNTRYLHEEINEFAEALLNKLPKELSVLHFVNSGSEANELALRMCETITGNENFIAIEVGYHGNTNAVMDVSSYKFDSNGGKGKPADTHLIPLPDPFRGRYRGDDSGPKYAAHAQKIIEHLKVIDEQIAGFIGEPIISCGGQITPPPNFFKEVYNSVREAGGLCIADEVQTGFGRVGKTFWAFQLHDVIPDIVTMGKPVGNGHPLAVVACTKEVAEAFANGLEFFNTFGGNPVSCAIGKSVLEVIDAENLQQNALEVGEFLKRELKQLRAKYPIIGDIRGEGLFLGIELTNSEKEPLANHASYLANRMKDFKILMSTDGPDHNVMKIKPPMVFSMENAKTLILRMQQVLAEDFMKHYEPINH